MKMMSLWRRDNGVCWLCLDEVDPAEASRDHILPKSQDGKAGAYNLKLAHLDCNVFRKTVPEDKVHPPEVFLRHRAFAARRRARRDMLRETATQRHKARRLLYATLRSIGDTTLLDVIDDINGKLAPTRSRP